MRVSFNAIEQMAKRYGSTENIISAGASRLVKKIGAQLGAVEEVIEFGAKFEGVLIAKVVSCEKHPNADKLSVCLIDDGGKAQNVERDKEGLIRVVCGASNVRAGLMVAWLPPGSTVPSSYGKEPFVVGARELRGIVSNGMIASGKELGISDDHEGILEIDEEADAGASFAEVYGLKGDIIIDIENKMFTHRPDCFGYLGLAREIAGIQQIPFKSPDWYVPDATMFNIETDEIELEVLNEVPELVPRFTAIAMSGIKVGTSPVWLQIQLARAGIRSINSVVDLTNFLMLETGQPLHAYDYDKVMAQDEGSDHATIKVRKPKPGEKIKLLNGKEIEPRSEAAMIATRDKLIGIGGVMGGSETEVDEKTDKIIIEVANFDMYSIRRTSMEHGLFTDAVTRFSKGQSPLQTKAILAKAVDEVRELSDGKVASKLVDEQNLPDNSAPVETTSKFVNARLGLSLTNEEIAGLLKNVEFQVSVEGQNLKISVPFWRTDISIPEDIVEEVGRLYGYDKLPLELPSRSTVPPKPDKLLQIKSEIRRQLASFGANEVLNYSFVHGDLIEKSGQDKELAFKLTNALSPDLQFYRMSLIPSLLANVHPNIKAGYGRFALFELGKSHNRLHKDDDNGVPKEYDTLSLVYAGKTTNPGQAYYNTRAYLDGLAESIGISVEYRAIEKEAKFPVVQPFDLDRSALAFEAGSNIALGIIGEFKASVRQKLKLPAGSAGFEIGINELMASKNNQPTYKPLSRYPAISQDICLQVESAISYAELLKKLSISLEANIPKDQVIDVKPIDIYASDQLGSKKRITFRVTLTSHTRTLTEDVLSGLLDKVSAELKNSLSSERI